MTATALRSAAPPWAPANMLRAWFWGTALALAAVALTPNPAHAGAIGETAEEFSKKVTGDPTAQKEIGEAVETLIEAIPDAHEIAKNPGAKGGPKPISGPFQELVVNFDKLACAAWIVSFDRKLLELVMKRDPETPPQVIAAAQNLRNKVIFACRKIIDPDTNYDEVGTTGGKPGGGSGSGTAGGVPPDGPGAQGVDVIDGEPVLDASDRVCWKRCADKWSAWKGAEGLRQRAEDQLRRTRLRADTLESDTIPWMERRVTAAQNRLNEALGKRPRSNFEVESARAEINNLRTEIRKMREEVAQRRQEARDLEAQLPGLRAAEQAALKAYLDCLKACGDQARAAGKPSTFVDKTLEALTPRLQVGSRLPVRFAPEDTAETRTARLAAIGGLRTGQVGMSGTEVTLALPIMRDFGGQARSDALQAMGMAKAHGYPDHSGGQAQAVETAPAVTAVPAEAGVASPTLEVIEQPAPVAAPPSEGPYTDTPDYFPQPVEPTSVPRLLICPEHPTWGPHSH